MQRERNRDTFQELSAVQPPFFYVPMWQALLFVKLSVGSRCQGLNAPTMRGYSCRFSKWTSRKDGSSLCVSLFEYQV